MEINDEMKNLKLCILLFLITAYVIYSAVVYTIGTQNENNVMNLNPEAVRGKMLWQEKNCVACHQIYGLGGYMGPDLTNVISAKDKGENYAKAVLKSGTRRMPNFNLNEEEVQSIAEYLKFVDGTGKFPAKNFELTWYGTVENGQ